MWRCACVYFRLCLWASGVSYCVVGLERLDPASHYFFACNHRSDFDIPLAFAAIPFWLISIAKSSIAWVPIFGWAVALAGSVFVDRSDRQRAVGALDRARDDLVRRPRYASPANQPTNKWICAKLLLEDQVARALYIRREYQWP
jgi:1-acyl-sn-glycerol-3-phosphate acyltransferase